MCAYAPVQALGVFPASQKDVIGFGVYYGIVGAAVAAGALLGWNLTLPLVRSLLLLLPPAAYFFVRLLFLLI